MFIFMMLVRATALVIAGYFVWFAASRSDERMQTIGKYLAMWTFVVAILYVIGSLAMPYMRDGGRMGRGHFGPVAMRMHRFGMMGGPGMMMNRGFGMHRFMGRRDGNPSTEQNPANAPSTPSTQPATPTPAPAK